MGGASPPARRGRHRERRKPAPPSARRVRFLPAKIGARATPQSRGSSATGVAGAQAADAALWGGLRLVPTAVVLTEKVEGEVPRRVPPNGVNVIRVVLGIVVLDEEPRSVQPEVVRVTGLQGAGPGKMGRAEARLADAGPLRLGEIGPEVPDELLHQALGQRALRGP